MIKIATLFVRLIDLVSGVLYRLSGLNVVLLTGLVFLSILMRYIFNSPLEWGDEIASYMFVFVVFMGAAEMMREGKHIRVDFIVESLGMRKGRIIDFIILCISFFWCVILDWASWKTTLNAYNYGMASSSLLRFPLFISYSFVSIGLAVLALQLMVLLGKKVRELSVIDERKSP